VLSIGEREPWFQASGSIYPEIFYFSEKSLKTLVIEVKPSRYTPWRRLGGEEYSSYSFTTSELDGGEWSASRPGRALPPVPIVQEAGWAPEPVWTERLQEKSVAPAGIEPRSPGCTARNQTLYCLN
jgi:hypothetical protein